MSWVPEQRMTLTLRGLGDDMAGQSEQGTNGLWYWRKVYGERAERVDGMMGKEAVNQDVSMPLYICSRN